MKEIGAIILAGGNGSRMGVPDIQKCLLPIDEKPVLGQVMDNLVVAFGSVDVKIGVAYRSEQVIDYVQKNKPSKVDVTYIPHVPGTEGWGIYKEMKEYIRGPFVAMPGDVLALPHVYEDTITLFESANGDGAMTLSPQLDVVDTHGVGKIDNGSVIELQWPPPEEADQAYARDMTIWASDLNFFDIIDCYPSPKKSIGVVFMKAIHDGRPIAGNLYKDQWIHLGYPEDLKKSLKRA